MNRKIGIKVASRSEPTKNKCPWWPRSARTNGLKNFQEITLHVQAVRRLWEIWVLGPASPSSVAAWARLNWLKFMSQPDIQKHVHILGIPVGHSCEGAAWSPPGKLVAHCEALVFTLRSVQFLLKLTYCSSVLTLAGTIRQQQADFYLH